MVIRNHNNRSTVRQKVRKGSRARVSQIEPLEYRRLLSASVTVSGNVLSLNGAPSALVGYSNYAIGNDTSASTDLAFLNKLATTTVTPAGSGPTHVNLTRVWLGFQWADGVTPFKIDHYAWQSGEAHQAGQQPPSDLDHAIYDLTILNDAYFARLANFVQTAADDGIVVQLCLFDAVQFDSGASDWARSPYNPDNNINDKNNAKNVYTGSPGSNDELKFLSTGKNSAMWTKVTQPLVDRVTQTLKGYSNVIYEILNEPNAHGFQAYNTIKGVDGASQTQTEVRDFHEAVTSALDAELSGGASAPVILVNVDSTAKLPLYNWAVSNPSVSILSIHTIYPNAETQSPTGLLGKHIEMSSDGDEVIQSNHAANSRLGQLLANAFSSFPAGDRSVEILDNSIDGASHDTGTTSKPKYVPSISSINTNVLKQIVKAAPQPSSHRRSDDLGVPDGLTGNGTTDSTVDLSWTYTGLSPDDFLVEENTGNAWVTAGTTPGSVNTFHVAGLKASTNYQLRVTAQIDGISGTPSNPLRVVTSAGVPLMSTGRITTPVIAPAPTAKGRVASLGSRPAVAGNPIGFLPKQVRTAYGDNQISLGGLPGDGTGQTIAIIDWGDDPYMVNSTSSLFSNSDLHLFDLATGLPDPPSFKKVDQSGGTNYPSAGQGTDAEISLDVEWAHAMAPGASILLVEASSNSDSNLFNQAINFARNQPGVSLITMSFGEPEFGQETTLDQYLTTPNGHQGVTFLASSGDYGGVPLYPSTSPNVVSVGGTSLYLNSGNSYKSESGWNGSGGGISLVESKPVYQESYAPLYGIANRATPDVAFLADPDTGVAIIDTADYGGWAPVPIGGTSLASPMLAGVLAVANQGRSLAGSATLNGVSDTLPNLYKLSQTNPADFHDITTGNNGYPAKPGYDFVTGLGTPVANLLVPDLIGDHAPVISSLTAQPGSETIGANFTLAANGVRDPDGDSVTVSFYRESNGLPGLQTTGQQDTLIGTSSSGFTVQVSTAGLNAGTYTYYAVASDKIGLSSQIVSLSNTVTNVAPPAPPENLRVTSVGASSTGLAWDASPTPDVIYRIAYGIDGVNFTHLDDASGTTYTATGLTTGTTYFFEVRAADSSEKLFSDYTNSVSATPSIPVPIAPTNLRVTAVGSNYVRLAWDPSPTSGVIYRIADSTDGGNFTHLDDTSDTTYTATGLASGTTYYFEVRATDSTEKVFSGYTNTVSATLSIPAPIAPTDLLVTTVGSNSVSLAWDPSPTAGVIYRIAVSTDGANFNHLGDTSATTYSAAGLTTGTTYYFEVRAADSTETVFSDYTKVVSATPTIPVPVSPTNLAVTSVGATSVSLEWNASSTPGVVYRIAYSTDGVNFTHLGDATGTNYTATGLTTGTTYYFKVRASDSTGTVYSSYSNTVNAAPTIPVPAPATNLVVTSIGANSIGLAWTASSTPGVIYRIAYSIDGVNFTHLGDAIGTTYTAVGLNAGVTYYFEVRVADSMQTVFSTYTNAVHAKTK